MKPVPPVTKYVMDPIPAKAPESARYSGPGGGAS